MYSVGVISGRSITELKSLVAIEGIYYAGNHGLEIEGPGLKYISPLAESARTTIKDLAEQMATALADVDGVIVQDKGMSLSIHYRLVKKEKESTVADVVRPTHHAAMSRKAKSSSSPGRKSGRSGRR